MDKLMKDLELLRVEVNANGDESLTAEKLEF